MAGVQASRLAEAETAGGRGGGGPSSRLWRDAKDGGGQGCRRHGCRVEAGKYLPPAPASPGFVFFKATTKDTPALRAGNVEPYEFILPPTWKQLRVANILSGNYCQPKCAEPWVEVKFEDERQGKVQVVASPLIRLTNRPNATIEDIGSPEKLIASLGPFVTGNTLEPEEIIEASVEKIGDLTTPLALTGSHNLAKATAKGSTVVLFVASASDKQWQSSEKILKAMGDFAGIKRYAVGRMTKSHRGKLYIDDAGWDPEAGSIEYGYRVPFGGIHVFIGKIGESGPEPDICTDIVEAGGKERGERGK
ncbi:hypothetical protein TRIUR3_09837 [Triticum urartu]|uniref:PsbP C-terminal domain-containing protein n=1 Tax=Triticum urartu TaxID=4572 RepID=M8B3Q6_TRIUA|nr:hypothetical protein TRIUR3_09837 [Triticum urartu]